MLKEQKNVNIHKKPKRIFWKFLCFISVLFPFIYTKRKQIKEKVVNESEHFVEILTEECNHLPKQFLNMKERFKNHLKDFFIPHTGNDHQPNGLSTKALKAYALILVIIKIVTVGFLFLTYPNPAVLSQRISQEIFDLTNTSRTNENIDTVVWNDELARAAQAKADNMVAEGYFAHVGPDGRQPWQWINKTNYYFLYMGENLAMDFSSAQIAHSAFNQSPSHWKNILNPKYQDMGVGVAVGKIDGRDTIVLVEFFGSQKASVATAAIPPAQAAEVPIVSPQPVEQQNIQVTPNPEPVEPPVVQPTPVQEPTPIVEPIKSPVVTEQPINTIPEPTQINLEPVETPVIIPTDIVSEPEILPQEIIPEITQPVEFSSGENPLIIPNVNELTKKGLVEYVIMYSQYAFLLFLVALFTMLLVNVVVKPHIQHNRMIMQTLGMLVLVATLLLTRFHFIEQIQQVIIF